MSDKPVFLMPPRLWRPLQKEPAFGFGPDGWPSQPKIRSLDTIPCPACGKIAWRMVNEEPTIVPWSAYVGAICECGKGVAQRYMGLYGVSLADSSTRGNEWMTRVHDPAADKAYDRWQMSEPKRWLDWDSHDLPAVCPACGASVTLVFEANHPPGGFPNDSEDSYTHRCVCTCGAQIRLDIPERERPEYKSEYAAWRRRQPKPIEWHYPVPLKED